MGHLKRVTPNKDTTQGIKVEMDSRGRMLDANTKEVLQPGKMDRGHKYGFEERVMQRCAEKCHMSQKDYRKMMQDSRLYQWESSRNNRSGKFECKDYSVQLHNCMEVIRDYRGKQRTRATSKFKPTEYSPRLKSNGRNIAGQKNGNAKTVSGARTISGARTASGRFSASKGSLVAASHGNSSGKGHGTTGASHGSTGTGHGGFGGTGHGGFGGAGHGGSSGGGGHGGGGHGGGSGGGHGGGGHGGK